MWIIRSNYKGLFPGPCMTKVRGEVQRRRKLEVPNVWDDDDNIPMASLSIIAAESPAQIAQARELFFEYADSLNFSLCFQSFDQELAGLPGDYAPPNGRLLLAEYDGQLAGCIALHKLDVRHLRNETALFASRSFAAKAWAGLWRST